MTQQSKKIEDYLGDGVYATFDGFAVTLDLRGQDNTTFIALDEYTMAALLRFVDRVKEENSK